MTVDGKWKNQLPYGPKRKALGRLAEEYGHYLHHQRGLSPSTIQTCLRYLEKFLSFRFGDTLGDFNSITPEDVIAYFRLRQQNPTRERSVPSHLRNLFKFLFWSGKTRRNLANSLPRVAHPSPTLLPRSLKSEEIERMLQAVPKQDIIGRRNYAMLLLMARMGVRPTEIIAIRLEDIDWRVGEILIRGKGKRHERMPIPPDVGEALVDYIRKGRAGTSRILFVTTRAPYPPFIDSQVLNDVLRQALSRVGLKPPQSYIGAHLLRHSLAMGMLKKGASLHEIGDVLRHRSRGTTALYARYDVDALRSIAQPWPVQGGKP